MSTIELRQIIHQLNRLDVDRTDFHYLVSLIRKASKGATATLYRKTEFYFRARVHNGENLTKLSEFGAPPVNLVEGFQRCNPPGRSMFYSASKRINALLECNVAPGDTVYLGQWICKEPPPINTTLLALNDLDFSQISKTDEVFYTYLDTIFTRPVHESFSNQYKLTAAASEVLTTNFIPHASNDVRSDGTVGLMYSSVAYSEAGHNIAFHAAFAADRLELVHLMKLKILARDGKQLKIEIVDNAIEFDNQIALWLGDQRAIPKLRTSTTHFEFISNGRNWLVPVRTETSGEEEVEALLQE
jgi:hypothetical protein